MGHKFQGGITESLRAQLQNCKTAKLHYFIHAHQSGVSHVFQESPRILKGWNCSWLLSLSYLPKGRRASTSTLFCNLLLLLSQKKSDKRQNVRYKLRLHPLFPCSFPHGKIAMSETSVQLWKWWLLDINSIRNLCSFVSGRGESAV